MLFGLAERPARLPALRRIVTGELAHVPLIWTGRMPTVVITFILWHFCTSFIDLFCIGTVLKSASPFRCD